jgi:Fringe-like
MFKMREKKLTFVLPDSRIPTIDIGVPNTKTGHCEKTMQIFKYVHAELERNATLRDVEWMILVDDDTLLG